MWVTREVRSEERRFGVCDEQWYAISERRTQIGRAETLAASRGARGHVEVESSALSTSPGLPDGL